VRPSSTAGRTSSFAAPTTVVGTLIDASGFHPGRRVRAELAIRAATAGIDDDRVDVVLDEVGMAAAADKRVGQLSLGMRQRLGLATALLGDPPLLVLDEPANGLDPAGMHWLRNLLRTCAARGTAVFVSSHVLAELALFADDVIVVNHGRLVTTSSVADLVASATSGCSCRAPSCTCSTTAGGQRLVAQPDRGRARGERPRLRGHRRPGRCVRHRAAPAAHREPDPRGPLPRAHR
jgi:ABC-2 type transport system ATP-binding protein